jgi:hypothetical protein
MPTDTGLKLRIGLGTTRDVVTPGDEVERENSLVESIDEWPEDQRRLCDTAAAFSADLDVLGYGPLVYLSAATAFEISSDTFSSDGGTRRYPLPRIVRIKSSPWGARDN